MTIVRWVLVGCLSLGCGLVHAMVTPWMDFQIVRGFVVIPTQVHGIKGYSVIDTGAQFTGIEHSFVERNNLQLTRGRALKLSGLSGVDVRPTYQNVPVTIMGAELEFAQLIDMELDERAQLLIGADFLRTLYFQFDYPNKRLRAISREAFDLKKLCLLYTSPSPRD